NAAKQATGSINRLGYPNTSAFGTYAYCASSHVDRDDSCTCGWVMRRSAQMKRSESNFVWSSHGVVIEMAERLFWFWDAPNDSHGTTTNDLALSHPANYGAYIKSAPDRAQWTRVHRSPVRSFSSRYSKGQRVTNILNTFCYLTRDLDARQGLRCSSATNPQIIGARPRRTDLLPSTMPDVHDEQGPVSWVRTPTGRISARLRRMRWWVGVPAPGFQDVAVIELQGPAIWPHCRHSAFRHLHPWLPPPSKALARCNSPWTASSRTKSSPLSHSGYLEVASHLHPWLPPPSKALARCNSPWTASSRTKSSPLSHSGYLEVASSLGNCSSLPTSCALSAGTSSYRAVVAFNVWYPLERLGSPESVYSSWLSSSSTFLVPRNTLFFPLSPLLSPSRDLAVTFYRNQGTASSTTKTSPLSPSRDLLEYNMKNLPSEILDHIMQEILADDGRSGTLARTDGVLSLTEVCRFLRPIAQRVYYRAITYDPLHERFQSHARPQSPPHGWQATYRRSPSSCATHASSGNPGTGRKR
ncbi:hypothetical protein FPV67DRAFT_1462010, partial [Lyophyllum atratum]